MIDWPVVVACGRTKKIRGNTPPTVEKMQNRPNPTQDKTVCHGRNHPKSKSMALRIRQEPKYHPFGSAYSTSIEVKSRI